MIITALLENATISKEYQNKHGLCLHLQTAKHRILFDLGPDDTFIKNASKLNISIPDVDMVILSHGHKDHGGGLAAFLQHNKKATIYVRKGGFGSYYASLFKYIKVYVGLDQELRDHERIVFTDEIHRIDDELTLVSHITGRLLAPSGNRNLLMKTEKGYELDDFRHEQHLIVRCEDKYTLISGCSHTGILNILDECQHKTGLTIGRIIGGLHQYNPLNRKTEARHRVEELGQQLLARDVDIHTCHCTGLEAYELLKPLLRDRIQTLHTGQIVNLAHV